ncbi:putative DD41D transposase [Trichonephila clavipes]|uniref:Putative DD41D transposase n=1 Tax=Trichonephila clavipes TaxID=2585209 RepID=A0A8X6R9N5_TRICX|nr:putative DD41D transposase [Trichonephila clavipes]
MGDKSEDQAGKNREEMRWSCQVIYSQFSLSIHQNDHQARRRFVEWAQNEINVVPDFHKRILFSDEAHFWLNGYVNKQNCRIWSESNPQVYVETPLHPEKLMVWCALWAGGIIGPYFFKNDEGHNVTVNGNWYRAMITNFFIPELNNHDVQELWFQQDGATCHTARATIDLLKDTFGDRLISRFGPVNWPPRSCDLTPLDYFLWGYVKSLVYAGVRTRHPFRWGKRRIHQIPFVVNNNRADVKTTVAILRDRRPPIRRQHSPCYCRYTATNVGKSHRKLDVQIGLHPSQPWQSYARNHTQNVMPQDYLSNNNTSLFYCNLKFCTSKKTPSQASGRKVLIREYFYWLGRSSATQYASIK